MGRRVLRALEEPLTRELYGSSLDFKGSMLSTSHMNLADKLRSFAYQAYIQPALASGRAQIAIRAGDVHADMGLQNRMPAVCGALGSKIFENQFGLELLRRTGPPQGANSTFCFRLRGFEKPHVESSAFEKKQRATKPVRRPPRSPNDRFKTIFLVSCVGRKRPSRARAKDLYLSDWFIKARNLVEASGAPWFILSAEHGLIAPDDLLEPYEKTLNTMSASDRRRWAERVISQMFEKMPEANCVTFLAGKRYREFLEDYLRDHGVSVEIPMEGLRIGEQLAWLGAQTDDG